MRSGRSGDELYVTAFGRVWQLKSVPAWEWVRACASPNLEGVFPGLVRGRDAQAIFDLCTLPDFDRRCANAARKALERASGREWWWAYNMIVESRKAWIVTNGRLMLSGVDSRRTNLADWLDAAFVSMMSTLDDQQRQQLDSRLRRIPTTGVAVRPKMSTREDLLAFARE